MILVVPFPLSLSLTNNNKQETQDDCYQTISRQQRKQLARQQKSLFDLLKKDPTSVVQLKNMTPSWNVG